jgi:hypothetical protein
MDYTALKTELTTDPKSLGYAPLLTATNDAGCAALLNATTGNGAATVNLPSLTHDQFALLIAPVVMALGSATTALQTKWTPMLQLLGGVQTVMLNQTVMGLINALSAGFPTQLPASAITAATTKTGSRAEVLFGAGTVIQWTDIAHAMGRM